MNPKTLHHIDATAGLPDELRARLDGLRGHLAARSRQLLAKAHYVPEGAFVLDPIGDAERALEAGDRVAAGQTLVVKPQAVGAVVALEEQALLLLLGGARVAFSIPRARIGQLACASISGQVAFAASEADDFQVGLPGQLTLNLNAGATVSAEGADNGEFCFALEHGTATLSGPSGTLALRRERAIVVSVSGTVSVVELVRRASPFAPLCLAVAAEHEPADTAWLADFLARPAIQAMTQQPETARASFLTPGRWAWAACAVVVLVVMSANVTSNSRRQTAMAIAEPALPVASAMTNTPENTSAALMTSDISAPASTASEHYVIDDAERGGEISPHVTGIVVRTATVRRPAPPVVEEFYGPLFQPAPAVAPGSAADRVKYPRFPEEAFELMHLGSAFGFRQEKNIAQPQPRSTGLASRLGFSEPTDTSEELPAEDFAGGDMIHLFGE